MLLSDHEEEAIRYKMNITQHSQEAAERIAKILSDPTDASPCSRSIAQVIQGASDANNADLAAVRIAADSYRRQMEAARAAFIDLAEAASNCHLPTGQLANLMSVLGLTPRDLR